MGFFMLGVVVGMFTMALVGGLCRIGADVNPNWEQDMQDLIEEDPWQ